MESQAPEPRPPSPRPQRPRRRRWLRWLVVCVLALLVVAVIAIQAVLWTDIPRRIVIAQVQRQLGLVVNANSMSTGWLGHTVLRDVKISLPLAEQSLIDVPALRVDHTALLPLLLGFSFQVDAIELNAPVLHLRQNPSGTWNVEQAIELVARTAGSKQTQQPGGAKNPLRLPDLRVNDAKLYVADNRGQTTPIDQINVTGWREGLLTYKYDADIQKHLHLAGEIAPTNRWDHEVRFAGKDLNSLLDPLVRGLPQNLNADGVWHGRLSADGIDGRLDLTSLSAANLWASGGALVSASSGKVEVRPERLAVTAASHPAQLVSGLVTIQSTAIQASDLLVSAYDGQAILAGQWNPADHSADLRGTWRQVAFPAAMSQTGSIHASLQTPWPNKPQIDADLTSSTRSAAGTLDLAMHLNGQGDSFRNLDWIADFQQLKWAGKQSVSVNNVVAHLATRGQQILLESVAMKDNPSAPLQARGQFDLSSRQWWAWLYSPGMTLPSPDRSTPLNLAMNLNAWGNTSYYRLQELYARSGDLEIVTDGFYDTKLPKPLNVQLQLGHLPLSSAPELSQIIQGELTGGVGVVGTVSPLDLELKGQLHGRDLRLQQRPMGDLDVQLIGAADDNSIRVHTTDLYLLGGRWQVAGDWSGQAHQPVQVQVDFEDLPLGQVGQFVHRPQISGNLTGHATLDLRSLNPRRIEAAGTLACRDLSLPPMIDAQQASAKLHLGDGMLRIDPIELKQQQGTATAKIELAVDRPKLWNVQVSSNQWPLQAPSRQAAAEVTAGARLAVDLSARSATGPIQIAAHLTERDRPVGTIRVEGSLDPDAIHVTQLQADVLGGSARGSGNIDTKSPLQSNAQLDVHDIDSSEFAAWVPQLNGLIGRLNGSFSLAPSDDPQHALGPLRLEGSLQVEGGQFRGLKINSFHTTSFFDTNRFVTNDTTLELADGTASIFARASRRPNKVISSLATLSVEKLDLNQIVHCIGHSGKPMPGRVQGRFTLAGDPQSPRQMFGDGDVRITESDLANFEPIRVLYNLMHVSLGSPQPTGTATLHARLEGENLAITDSRIFNRGVEIRALGVVRDIWQAPDSPIEGSAVGSARPLKDLKLPFMADVDQIFNVLQSNVTSVRIGGTLSDPKVAQATLADLGQAMQSLLLGDVRGETQGSAGR